MWQASQIFATQVNKIALFLLSLRFICGDSDLIGVAHAMLCFNYSVGVLKIYSLFKWLFYAACRLAGFRVGEISKFVDNDALTEKEDYMLVQFGNNLMEKIPRRAKIERGRRPNSICLSGNFFIQLFPNWTARSPITYTN